MAETDIKGGVHWGDCIKEALAHSGVVIIIISDRTAATVWMEIEIQIALHYEIPIVAFRTNGRTIVEDVFSLLSRSIVVDGDVAQIARDAKALVPLLTKLSPDIVYPEGIRDIPEPSHNASKGYVFISYIQSDVAFVERLRSVLAKKNYSYWDYTVGARDYHRALYRELEERIDGAKAFITIVTDRWRESEWVASEYIYAKEAGIPIFVIQASPLTRPLPILLNLQTRIDMGGEFETGAITLINELGKKGL